MNGKMFTLWLTDSGVQIAKATDKGLEYSERSEDGGHWGDWGEIMTIEALCELLEKESESIPVSKTMTE